MNEQQRNIVKLLKKIKEGSVKIEDLSDEFKIKLREAVKEIEEEDKLIEPKDKEEDPDLIDEPPIARGSVMKEYSESERQFFKRPLINKAFTRVKRIWQRGGKKNEHLLFREIKDERELLAPMMVELVSNRDYQKFLKRQNFSDDIRQDFLKAVYVYFNGIARIDNGEGNVEERKLEERELEDIWNSFNVFRFHVFIESIIKFRRYAFKEPVVNT